MKHIFNLKRDIPDKRDYIFIDFNKHFDVIKYLIYQYIMDTSDHLPATDKEYINYFLKLKEFVRKDNERLAREDEMIKKFDLST